MRRALALAACLSVSACGAGSHAMHVDETRVDEAQVEQSGALSLLTLERPMGDTIALSLWVDAGTFDGPNASHALVAARIASARAGVEMRVTPDATSFRQLCTRVGLDGCVDSLGRALSVRDVSEDEFAAALTEIRLRRERGLADSQRASMSLAVESLLGHAVRPLGDAEDEITRESLNAFLRTHYGPNRALLIAVGAHEHDALHAASLRIDGPLAETSRGAREEREGTLHAMDESHLAPAWTFAARGESELDAEAMASAWSARAGSAGQVSLFPTRLGWVATLTLTGNDPALLSHAATWMRARGPSDQAREDRDAWSLSYRHGDEWSAHPEHSTSRVAFAGAGQVDASLTTTIDALLAPRSPVLTRSEHRVHVTLDGGGMDVVDALGGERGTVELRFEGAAMDGPNAGASAIAVEALHARCFASAEVTLEGAALRVIVRDAPSLLADRAAWIIDCVALTRPSNEALDHAQRTRIAHTTDDAERRAIVARMLSPQASGWILSEGSRTSLADTTLRDVEARIAAWAQSVEVRVGWPTHLHDDDILALTQRILPPRTDHAEALRRPPATQPIATDEMRVRADAQGEEVILAVRVDGADLPGSGAGACAPIEAWAHVHAMTPTWRASGEARDWSWCAIALPSWPEGDAPSVDVGPLRRAIEASTAQAARALDLSRADVAEAARALWEDADSALSETLEVSVRHAFVEPAPPALRRR